MDINSSKSKKMGRLKHLYVTIFLASFSGMVTMPSITDVTMSAICPAQDECSFAIYLSGFHQAVTGMGSVVMTPLIGNLSDVYGRKALLTLPLTLSILPLVIMAYSRERGFFYAYYGLKTLASMTCEGATHCLSLAYLADNVSEGKRASAFGVLAGVGSAAFVCGTIAARFLSTAQTFQVGAVSAMGAAAYMRIFLKEDTNCSCPPSQQPLLKSTCNNITLVQLFNSIPTIHDIKTLLGTSKTFSQIALMVFFNGLADGGLQASLMYYLKARFHFGKNEYADLMLIVGTAGMISQLILIPMVEPIMGETRLLRMGLFLGCTNVNTSLSFLSFVSSIAPYLNMTTNLASPI